MQKIIASKLCVEILVARKAAATAFMEINFENITYEGKNFAGTCFCSPIGLLRDCIWSSAWHSPGRSATTWIAVWQEAGRSLHALPHLAVLCIHASAPVWPPTLLRIFHPRSYPCIRLLTLQHGVSDKVNSVNTDWRCWRICLSEFACDKWASCISFCRSLYCVTRSEIELQTAL